MLARGSSSDRDGDRDRVRTGGSPGDRHRALFGSLRGRNYRLLAAGQLASNTGTWIQKVAQDWLVLRLTHGSGTALGITTALQFLPLLLIGPWGGVLADRYPKRWILLVTQATMCLLAVVLGLLTVSGAVRVHAVYALALGLGLTTVFDKPALQTFMAEVVGQAELPNALALNNAIFNLARIVGPALAGLVISLFDVGPAFFLNSVSYLVVLAALLLMDTGELHTPPAALRGTGQLRAGLRYVRGRPDLCLTLVLVGFVAGFGMNFQITTALMATKVFHSGAGAFGLGSTMLAAGAVVGSLLAARHGGSGQRYLVAAALAFGVLEVGTGLMPSYPAFLVLLVPTGTALLLFTTAASTSMQLTVAAELRGRVTGLYMLLFLGTAPLIAPCIGWISQVVDPRAGLVLGGAVSAAAASAVGLSHRRWPPVIDQH